MEQKQRTLTVLQIMNVVAFVVVVVMNFLSNWLPLNGRTAGEISDALPSYFTPAGYTFSIWGVIYLGLLGFIVYQALPRQRERRVVPRVGWLFVLSSAANIAWLLAWHYGYYLLSVVFMVTLLLTLIAIYVRLKIGRPDPRLTVAERLLVHLPFSLYLGWITVATIANIASVVAHLGWDGFGIAGPVWSAIMMAVAVVVAGLLLWNRRNLAYAAVLVWALFGIRAAYPDEAIITTTAVVAAILVAALAIIGYWRTVRRQPKSDTAIVLS
ncbi:MAG: TspO/MBR family protein [Anaerolineae bacterium]|nr:TspO/MBR family protein [Anaerolineae bacterium]